MQQAAQALQAHLQAQGDRQVDALVYAVGDITAQKVAEMPLEAWRRILDANLTGAYVATRAFSPLFSPEPHLFYIGATQRETGAAWLERIRDGEGRAGDLRAGACQRAAALEDNRRAPRRRRHPLLGARAVPHAAQSPLSPKMSPYAFLEAYYNEQKGTLDIIPE
jgi:NAD(P)-dependent dehydrogenase (short-subunit alcohol dehydrogenase family)